MQTIFQISVVKCEIFQFKYQLTPNRKLKTNNQSDAISIAQNRRLKRLEYSIMYVPNRCPQT